MPSSYKSFLNDCFQSNKPSTILYQSSPVKSKWDIQNLDSCIYRIWIMDANSYKMYNRGVSNHGLKRLKYAVGVMPV